MKEHISVAIDLHEYDGVTLLESIHLTITADMRLGIVGENGVGKTTLFRLISGQEQPSRGSCHRHGGIRISFLSQLPTDDVSRTVLQELVALKPEIVELESALAYHEQHLDDPDSLQIYLEALETYKRLSGKELHAQIDRVLRGLGIFHLRDQYLVQVSGGERTKVALARILLSQSDLLFLDEPTNHLDLDATLWLENYLLNDWKGGCVIISHDRRFLDITCQKTAEVFNKTLQLYDGNYTFFMAEKQRLLQRQEQMYEIQQTHLASEKALISRFRAGSRASFAKSREKALDRLELREAPKKIYPPQFQFAFHPSGSQRSLYIEQAFIGRTEPLFVIHELQLQQGRHVGIIGANGVGKSTFMKTLTGEIPLLDGRMLLGEADHIGYYSQTLEKLLCDVPIRTMCARLSHDRSDEALMGLLSPYGFLYEDIGKSCLELSGGQRSKLAFALLGSQPHSLLFLDEPTNHLDMYAKESLEQSLKKFPGTIIFISHDRYFIDSVADELWVIENGEMRKSSGNYSDFLQKKEQGIAYDEELIDLEGEMQLVLEEKLGKKEAERIAQKYTRKYKR